MEIEIQDRWLVEDGVGPVDARKLRPLRKGEVVVVMDYAGQTTNRFVLTPGSAVKERLKAIIARDRDQNPAYAWVRSPDCPRMHWARNEARRLYPQRWSDEPSAFAVNWVDKMRMTYGGPKAVYRLERAR